MSDATLQTSGRSGGNRIEVTENMRDMGDGTHARVGVLGSAAYRSQIAVVRPANQTPYTAGDVIGGVIAFLAAGPLGGHLQITSCDVRIDVAAVPAGMTTLRLHLYNVTPPSALADNAAWDLPAGDRASYIGYIDFAAPVDHGSTLSTQVENVGKHVKLAAAETALYAYLVTTGAFTPAANSEVYTPTIRGVAI